MRENEFEQKVQEQLDELHLRPSASVWYQVERELRRKKKRRVAFYFSILAGLGLLGYLSVSLLSNQPSSSSTTAVPSGQAQKNSISVPAENKNNTAAAITDNSDKSQQKENTTTTSTTQTDNKTLYTYKPDQTATKGQFVMTQTAPSIQKAPGQQVNPQLPVTSDAAINKPIAKTEEEKKETDVTDNSVDVKKDSAVAKTDPDNHPEAESQEPVIANTKKPKDRKIKWGFDVSAGVNFSRDKALSLPQSNLAFADFNQNLGNYYSNGPVTNVAGPYANLPVRPPSPVKAGRAFKAGVNAEIKLSERSSILTALRYAYLSETIKVGSFAADTVIASSYAGLSSNDQDKSRKVRAYYGPNVNAYRNTYHFIELPLSYQLQLNKSKKMQVLWNGGVLVSYMFATNALVYDTAARGIYYKSKEAFNKLHFGFLSGLSLRFGDRNKLQWSIGPEFSMDMTGLLKQDVILEKRYLLYGGVTARMFLPGKKK
jgi:hypothetical protein